jgi:hypothetical protein
LLAIAAAAIDQISLGQFVCWASDVATRDCSNGGAPPVETAHPVAEYVHVIRELLTGRSGTFAGQTLQVSDLELDFTPYAAPIPVGLTRFDGHPESGSSPERMSIMEDVERKKPRPRRSFTAEFKSEIVELCQRGGPLGSAGDSGFRSDQDGGARVGCGRPSETPGRVVIG